MMILGVNPGPWTWIKGRSRGYAYVVLMPKPKSRFRLFSLPALSTLSVFCGSALLGLAFVSMLVSHLLDPAPHSGPPIQLRQMGGSSNRALLHDLRTVPGGGDLSSNNVWETDSANHYYGCSNPGMSYTGAASPSSSKGYLMIEASGGLNQQRTGITDAVVVARLLNATLVVPDLDHKSYWKDTSNFSDIFDVNWFIKTLASDVPIVKELPLSLKSTSVMRNMRVPRKCTPQYYHTKILPLLQKKGVVRLTKFDYRLSNKLDTELQKLRCRVNYKALQFTPQITNMGNVLVDRMRSMSKRYIALHLRFEPDMLAFSGCYYGGGDKEIAELGAIRKRWKTLHVRNPERERRNGKCPLTPQEVGLMLRALGFGNESYVYVASGEVYGGNATLAPLKAMFPNLYTKERLASKEELQPFLEYSSRMAALDYVVCDESNVFVTNNNGNMARILAGRRRFYGHKKSIRPNSKKLGSLLMLREKMTWHEFANKVKEAEKGFMGNPNEVKAGRGEFHENPTACICRSYDGDERRGDDEEDEEVEEEEEEMMMSKMVFQEIDDPFNSYDNDRQVNVNVNRYRNMVADEMQPLFSD